MRNIMQKGDFAQFGLGFVESWMRGFVGRGLGWGGTLNARFYIVFYGFFVGYSDLRQDGVLGREL